MDSHEGHDEIPLSLREYLFTGADPIDNLDPSANEIDEVSGALFGRSPALHGNRPSEGPQDVPGDKSGGSLSPFTGTSHPPRS